MKKIVLLIVLILIGVGCHTRELYVSFDKNDGYYRVYKQENFKIYYKPVLKEEFLNNFSSVSIEAIKIYENLNGSTPVTISKNQYCVAIVKQTCGVGCGIIGKPGIEIEEKKFDRIYKSYTVNKKFDSLIFYELGRNFWFYNKQLTCSNPALTEAMRTGFAVFMRNICVGKLRIEPDSLNGYKYSDYLKELKSIYGYYSEDSTLNITKTLYNGELPVLSSHFMVTSANFWASLLYHLYDKTDFGDPWLYKVWHEVSLLPPALNENDVLNNFYIACCKASGRDLRSVFQEELKWGFSN